VTLCDPTVINHLQEIKAMKAAKQLQESQKKAEEEAKRKEEDETKRIEKAKKASENETRNQIAAEVGSSRYEVEMLEKLKAKYDSGSKMAEMSLTDESISLQFIIYTFKVFWKWIT
jgi:hypothetical protein